MRFGATVGAVVALLLAAVLVWPHTDAGRTGRASRAPVTSPATAPIATPSPSRSAAPTPRPPASPGALVDADDFTGTAIDRSKWEVYQAAASNRVSQWLTSMVTVTDGELDFVETPAGPKTTAIGTVHWGADNQQDARRSTGDFTAWHTYSVEWRPTFVKMSIDGRVYYDSTRSTHHPAIPSGPMQLAIQQEPGPFGHNWVPAPNGSTPDQVVLHVDWVRIYH